MRGVALSVIGRMTDVGQGANARNPFSTKTLAHLLPLGARWRRSSETRGLPLIPDMDEQLLEEFLRPMGITARRPAAAIDVPPIRISDIVHCRRPVIADTGLRLELFFSMDPRFGLTLQTEYDLRMARRRSSAELAERVRVFQT